MISLISVYFISGLVGLASVTMTFLKAEVFMLSAVDWSNIAILAGLPWSIKIIYATFIDGFAIFGSHRKAYIILGSTLMILGNLLMIDAISYHIIPLSQFWLMALDVLLVASGIVINDIVADTLAVDVVPKSPEETYPERLGRVGIYSRYALIFGSIASALLTGFLAKTFQPETVLWIWMICPLALIISQLLSKVPEPKINFIDRKLLKAGLIYISALILILFIPKSIVPWIIYPGTLLYIVRDFFRKELGWKTIQIAARIIMIGFFIVWVEQTFQIFLSTLGFILYISKDFLQEISPEVRTKFIYACIAIFLFRVIPSPAEPVQWWMINSLGLNQAFFGNLKIVGTLSGIIGLFLARNWIVKSNIALMLSLFTILDIVFSVPTLMVYYGFTFGISPDIILLLETAAAAPLGNIAMIPLHILLAQYAPENRRAIYIATTAAFVNLALLAGDMITKWLNEIFIVTTTDFSQLGYLLVSSLGISILCSLLGIFIIRRK